LSLAAFGQDSHRTARIPDDPLEIATGQIQSAAVTGSRAAMLSLVERARGNYALRGAGQAYDLKVRFTVDSGGRTQYDGVWEMEDTFDPKLGLRWTAKGPGGYSVTRISTNGMLYGDDPSDYIPLRLHEARAALFDPMPSAQNAGRASMRTTTGLYHGTSLTCILLSDSVSAVDATAGRRWDETEECIDPQSGRLQTHSQVPGRYYAYEYGSGPQLAGRVLPSKVTVTEAGKTITTITVESVTQHLPTDASLFVPTDAMRARGRAALLSGAQKISRVFGSASSADAHTVCVFGVVTPSGQLVEAHSLQPSDPNSDTAVAAVTQMSFARPAGPGSQPQQHFVFIIGRFVGVGQ
jgi:hypothetical protein